MSDSSARNIQIWITNSPWRIETRYICQRASVVAQWWRIHLQCRRCRRHGFNLWIWKILWRRKWQPKPVLFPGESHGQRSLAGCGPKGCKESDKNEATKHSCTCFKEVHPIPEMKSKVPSPPLFPTTLSTHKHLEIQFKSLTQESQ